MSCCAVEATTRAKLSDVRQKIRELKRMEVVLEKLATSCAARESTDECPVLETIQERTRGDPDARVQ
ncbi:MAG: hypothetical protein KY464_18580 [Gemmatimonadetes bacterium]|nr:hypothetical protein [Gemmatimonadota bacterium]